jgi:hypothetical protein
MPVGIPTAWRTNGERYFMQQHFEIEKHHGLMNFLLFGGLTAGLCWTLYIVWVGLVAIAGEVHKF